MNPKNLNSGTGGSLLHTLGQSPTSFKVRVGICVCIPRDSSGIHSSHEFLVPIPSIHVRVVFPRNSLSPNIPSKQRRFRQSDHGAFTDTNLDKFSCAHPKMTRQRATKRAKKTTGPLQSLDTQISKLVKNQLKSLVTPQAAEATHTKRLFSERDSEFESESDEEFPNLASAPKPASRGVKNNATKEKKTTEYASQAVVLEGVTDEIRRHPAKLSKAFSDTKPNVELRAGGLRQTASGNVLVIPKNPKDCNALVKENAFPANCPLGQSVKARLPKSQTLTHQVIIKGVDPSVTDEEMEEMLQRQQLPFKAQKRIHSRARNEPTHLIRLILNDEKEKKRLLKEGINLDQAHFKCIEANEDKKTYPKISQCFKCQKIGDHLSNSCKNEQKCVLCAGSHRKSDCTATKDEYKCANCGKNHAAWDHECEHIIKEINGKKKPTMAQIASATVTPAMLDGVIENLMESIAMIVAETVSRCLCELTLDLVNKTLNKSNLPARVEKVSSVAAKAATRAKIANKQFPVNEDTVKNHIRSKCFHSSALSATPNSQQMAGQSSQNGS